MFCVPEEFRIADGPMGSTSDYGNCGAFRIPACGVVFMVIAGDGLGWEHVSVSLNLPRTPTWEEMCFIKLLFWGEDTTVVEFHPKASEYVNNHPHVLHLWRSKIAEYRLPPKEMI